MNMKRKAQLIKEILNHENAISVSFLANKLDVSNKTVRNDLVELKDLLEKSGLKLIKKPGYGVQILGDRFKISRLIEYLEKEEKTYFTPKQRQDKILETLFVLNRSLLMKELALDFYVSRATITADIAELNEKLKRYELSISYIKGQGLTLVGDEVEIRKAFASLFPSSDMSNEYPDYFGVPNANYDFVNRFKVVLGLDYSKIVSVLKEAEVLLGFEFTLEAQTNLSIHLAIAIRRMMQGNEIVLSDELVASLSQNDEINISDLIVQGINREFNVVLSDHERYYILLHILSAKRTHENIDSLPFRLDAKSQKLVGFIKKLIQNVQGELQIFLEADDTLFNYLLLHLNPTLSRLRFGLTVDNPLFEDISVNYADIYKAIELQKPLFLETFGLDLPAHEIAYLVLHFAASRERNMKPKNVIVLCASGLGTSQFLVSRLKRRFANLNIVDVISNADLRRFEKMNIDLVISTIQVVSTLPVVIVNPILDERDINLLRTWFDDDRNVIKSRFELSVENTHIGVNLRTKHEVLNYLSNQMTEKGFVLESYLESLWERERIGSTIVGPLLAVPHGKFDAVIKSCIQIVTLNDSIPWTENESVKVIINVVATREDAGLFANLFRNLAYKVDEVDFMKKLFNATSRSELRDLVQEELINECK